MSFPREVRAQAVLEAAQRAVRCRSAFTDGEEELAERQNEELIALNSQLRYYREAAEAKGVPLSKDQSREIVYGMPYAEWQAQHQTEASDAQKAAFATNRPKDH